MSNRFEKMNYKADKQRKFSWYFVVLALIISAVSFFLLLQKSRVYQSEISIIFIPKSELSAQDGERIVGNMEIFPTKAFFYGRMAKYNENIGNKISDFSSIKVQREKKSSILKISASAENREDSILTSKTAATTLFNVMGFYYDIKKDADFRIIDGPIVSTTVKNPLLITIISLLIGILVSLIFFFVSGFNFRFSVGEHKEDANEFFGISDKTATEPEIRVEEEVYEIKAKPPVVSKPLEKKSPAPENLPSAPGELTFIDEDYFRNNIIKGAKPEPKKIEEPEEIILEAKPSTYTISSEGKPEPVDFHREPTPEELKKRLNQLLRGEL